MKYTLIRQSRKTVGIYITKVGVEVRAPLRMPKAEIDAFVAEKEPWIVQKLTAQRKILEQKLAFTLEYGTMLLWRGREYPLLGDAAGVHTWLDEYGFHLPPNLDGDELREKLIRLYKNSAKTYLRERVRQYGNLMNLSPREVKISEAKTRWGSCAKHSVAGKNREAEYNINFSWRLMMAEDDVIDAVVVHELAHMREMNHSPAFYAIVKSVLPDYDARNVKLRQFGQRMNGIDL